MPSSSRNHNDPFITTNSTTSTGLAAPSLRHQTSQQSLRSNASTASGRTAPQQRDFLRRPPIRTRNTPRVEDDVLADTESEPEPTIQRRRPHLRKIRNGNGSPETRTRARQRQHHVDEADIVNRKPDGNYLLDGSGIAPAAPVTLSLYGAGQQGEHADEADAHYSALARKYFTSGAHMNSRLSKQLESDFELDRPDMMMGLREEVMQKIEDERWLYEPVDQY